MRRPELSQNTPRTGVPENIPLLPPPVPARFMGMQGVRHAAIAFPNPQAFIPPFPHLLAERVTPPPLWRVGVTGVMQTDATLVSSPPAQELRHAQFFARVAACDTYDRLNDEVAGFAKAIDDKWGNEQNLSFLWEAVTRRLRGIASKHRQSRQSRSFFHYPAIARLVIEMAHNMAFFNLCSLSYALSDLAYVIKHEKNAGLSSAGDAIQSIYKLFSELPDYISNNFTTYCQSDNRDVSGCLGRLYTAIVIAKALGLLDKRLYLATAKMLVERLNDMVGSLESRVVREAIWCISKGVSQGIYEADVPLIKSFLDNLLRNSDSVVDNYNAVDINALMVSLLRLVEDGRYIYIDQMLCVQHIDLITGSMPLRDFKGANDDDLWGILRSFVKIKKHLPQLNDIHLLATCKKLLSMLKNKLLGIVSVTNNDEESIRNLLELLRDISNQKIDEKVYFHFFDAFYSSYHQHGSRPYRGWPEWHLKHLQMWMKMAFSQYAPFFQGNKRMEEEWKNMFLYSWLELLTEIMISARWDRNSSSFDRDRKDEIYLLTEMYDFCRKHFSDSKLKNKFEIFRFVSSGSGYQQRVDVNVARLKDASFDPRFFVCKGLTTHISNVFKDVIQRNMAIMMYGSASMIDYCIKRLFEFDVNAFFLSRFSLFVNDFDFMVRDPGAQEQLFNGLCTLPDSIRHIVNVNVNEHLIGIGRARLQCKEVRFLYNDKQLAEIAINFDIDKAISGACHQIRWNPYLMFDDCFYIHHDPDVALDLLVPDQQFSRDLIDKGLLSSDWNRKNRTLLNLLAVCFCEERLQSHPKEWQDYLATFVQNNPCQVWTCIHQ